MLYRLRQSEATDDETAYDEEQAHSYQYPLRSHGTHAQRSFLKKS